MNNVHRDYWEAFNRLGKEKLGLHGFSFELLPDAPKQPTLFRIKLTKGSRKFLLSFSSHHLDFQDGVAIKETGQPLLPPPELKRMGKGLYGYTDNTISEMIDDLCRL
jgi:hypothetical protein